MEIKTKYEIRQHIWIVYEDSGEVAVYDTVIASICYDKDGVSYITEECNDYKEEQIIPYEETDELIAKIKEIMNKIHEKEKVTDEC